MSKLSTRQKFLLLWLNAQFIFLLLSYSTVKVFNQYNEHYIKKFWPFVSFLSYEDKFVQTKINQNGFKTGYYNGEKEIYGFNGFFSNYDFTEFIFYSVIGIIIFNLTSQKQKE